MAKLNWIDDWPEYLALLLLIIGFITAMAAGSKVLAYVIVLVCGAAFGRVWYRLKDNLNVPWFLIILGFLIGFLLGVRYGSRGVVIILFVFGIVVSYYLHDKRFIKSVEY